MDVDAEPGVRGEAGVVELEEEEGGGGHLRGGEVDEVRVADDGGVAGGEDAEGGAEEPLLLLVDADEDGGGHVGVRLREGQRLEGRVGEDARGEAAAALEEVDAEVEEDGGGVEAVGEGGLPGQVGVVGVGEGGGDPGEAVEDVDGDLAALQHEGGVGGAALGGVEGDVQVRVGGDRGQQRGGAAGADRAERLLDVEADARGDLEEGDGLRVGVGHGVVGGEAGGGVLVGAEVALVAQQRDDDVLAGAPAQLLDPALRPGERLRLGDGVHDEGGLGAAVVHGRERPEALLARRVPHLQLDELLVVDLDRARAVRSGDRRGRRGAPVRPAAPSKAMRDARLANPRVTQ